MAAQAVTCPPAATLNAHAAEQPTADPAADPAAAFYLLHPEFQGLYPTEQPDIQWHPNREAYAERTKRRLLTEKLATTVPEGWPTRVEGPEVWEGQDLIPNEEPGDANLIVRLSAENISDLESAVSRFKKSDRPTPGFINQETFPLAERTRAVLRRCTERLYNGNGLLILRGLNPDKYKPSDNVLLYAGLTTHIGDRRGVQVRRTNEVLGHITDTGNSLAEFPLASHTNEAQPFHNDLGDILCLYVINPATTGGDSYVASTARLYNEIAATRPDLIRTMAEPWIFDTPQIEPGHYVRPILHHHKGRVTLNFARRLFTGYGASEGRSRHLPPLSEAQAEALDAIEYTAQKYKVSMRLERGDIQLQNNLATVHGRSGFTDDPEPSGRPRHMLRIWVRDEGVGWEIPPTLRSEWERVFNIKPEDQVWPEGPTYHGATDGSCSCS